jgi:hypothetical protein
MALTGVGLQHRPPCYHSNVPSSGNRVARALGRSRRNRFTVDCKWSIWGRLYRTLVYTKALAGAKLSMGAFVQACYDAEAI